MKILSLALLFVLIPILAIAQKEEEKVSSFKFSGFLDLYYGYDYNDPVEKKRLPFLYNHARHQTPAVNLTLVTGSYESGRFRANLGIQQGTYAKDNYASEPTALQWIHQANVGLALDEKKNLWLDAGVLPSHIGFEGAVSKDNLTLSRSIIAENSPYFETGVKLGWQASQRWYFAFLYLNGWQRIKSISGVNRPSFGTQATYSPSDRVKLNWSTFVGTDRGIEAGTTLYFSNMYGDFSLGQKWKIITGLDVGKRKYVDFGPANWWGMALITQYQLSENFATALRYEYYKDPMQAIAATLGNTGVEVGGLSLNLDRKIGKLALLRVEGRWLDSPNPLYIQNKPSEDFFLLASLALSWN